MKSDWLLEMFGINLSSLVVFGVLSLPLALLSPQLASDSTAVTSFLANTVFSHNLHEVVSGEFYRSAEMKHEDLESVINELGIKTVVDLRRGGDKKEAAENNGVRERDVAARNGAEYRHLPLNGTIVPSREVIQQLYEVFETAPKPMLVHCTSGTHRSGFAAFAYLSTKKEIDLDSAAKQLSPKYGFFAWERSLKMVLKGRPTIDVLVWSYLDEVKSRDVSFRQWLAESLAAESWKKAVFS